MNFTKLANCLIQKKILFFKLYKIFYFFKDHEKMMTRSFLEMLDSKSQINKNKASPSSKKHSSLKIFISLMLLILFLASVCYFIIERYLNLKRARKLNTNYTNLIESEFDTWQLWILVGRLSVVVDALADLRTSGKLAIGKAISLFFF